MSEEESNLLKPLILDATPIIYLSKTGHSNIFMEFKEEKFTTPKIVDEAIMKGKNLNSPDAFIAEELIQRSIIKVREPTRSRFYTLLSTMPHLHEGEVQVLALAEELKGIAIIDESFAREVSRLYNIETHGTAYLLLRLFYRGRLSGKQFRDILDELISAGWRLTSEEYAKLLKELDE